MTTKLVVLLPQADLDIRDAVDHYRAAGGPALAHRWIDAVQAGIEQIGSYPATGSARYAAILQLAGLRFWPIDRFPYLLFYVERDDQVDVWRVLHAQRDIPDWLSEPAR